MRGPFITTEGARGGPFLTTAAAHGGIHSSRRQQRTVVLHHNGCAGGPWENLLSQCLKRILERLLGLFFTLLLLSVSVLPQFTLEQLTVFPSRVWRRTPSIASTLKLHTVDPSDALKESEASSQPLVSPSAVEHLGSNWSLLLLQGMPSINTKLLHQRFEHC